MKLKLLLIGIFLLLFGFALAGATCPRSCPGTGLDVASGLIALAGVIIIPVSLVWSLVGRQKEPGMPVPSDPAVYLDDLSNRLSALGFRVVRHVNIPPYHLNMLAGQTRAEASKFGKMTRIIGVSKVDSADAQGVQDFSSRVTQYGLQNSGTILPRGFGGSVLVIPVLVSEDFDEAVKKWVDENFAPKHWAAFEFPVLISTRRRQAHYCKKTRIWGAAYYRGFRNFVESTIGSRIPAPPSQDPSSAS